LIKSFANFIKYFYKSPYLEENEQSQVTKQEIIENYFDSMKKVKESSKSRKSRCSTKNRSFRSKRNSVKSETHSIDENDKMKMSSHYDDSLYINQNADQNRTFDIILNKSHDEKVDDNPHFIRKYH
jgi:hypothetical protein